MSLKFAVLLLAISALEAAQGEATWKWSELPRLVTNRKVALVLPSGTHIEGKVVQVEPDGLRMRVSKTSDRTTMAKGEQLIPRPSVSVVRLTEYRKLGRLLCTLGALATAGIVIAAQDIDLYEGPLVAIVPAVAAGGTAGAGVAGYFIGKAIDKRVIDIRVAPQD